MHPDCEAVEERPFIETDLLGKPEGFLGRRDCEFPEAAAQMSQTPAGVVVAGIAVTALTAAGQRFDGNPVTN